MKFKELIKNKRILKEGLIPDERDLLEEIVLVASNEGDYYRKRDYKGAIEYVYERYYD